VAFQSDIAQRHLRRNGLAILGDYLSFGVGLVFVSSSTTLPAFAATLTSHKVLIGAVTAAWTTGWLLPQVLAANYLSNQPRKYPIMVRWQLWGRPVMLLFTLWLLLGGAQLPGLTLGLLLLTLAVFMGTDSVVALAWMDLLGKTLAPDVRARLIGLGQVLTGLGAIGAGLVIRWLLGPTGPAYPLNFAWLFGLAALCFAASTGFNLLIVEPDEVVPKQRSRLRAYLPEMARLLADNPAFRRVTAIRLLGGLSTLATSFYVVFATDHLGLPASTIGVFAGAATFGSTAAGLVLGPLASRFGTRRVVQVITWAQVSVPLVALLAASGRLGASAGFVFPLLYVLLGVYEGSLMLGFVNYVLDIAPPGQRPTYLGLTNTLAGLLIAVPLLGGLLLEATSYPVLFACAAVGPLAAAILSLRLAAPGQPAPATASVPEPQSAAAP
jgi:MFS family permease